MSHRTDRRTDAGPRRRIRLAKRSADHDLVAQHEAGRVPRAGVDVLDAAQVGLVVLQGRVAEAAGRNSITPSRATIQSGK